jgi:hypothetical protein
MFVHAGQHWCKLREAGYRQAISCRVATCLFKTQQVRTGVMRAVKCVKQE